MCTVILQAQTALLHDNAYNNLHAYVSSIVEMTGNMIIVQTKRLDKVKQIDGYQVIAVSQT